MNKMWKWCEIVKSPYFHMFFILFSYYFSYYFHVLGPGTRASAPKRRHRAQAGPGPPPLWGLGPGSGPQNVKIIWKWYDFSAFTLFSHLIHIIFILLSHFWARDPDPGPKSHIFVIFLVIFFSCFLHIFVYAWAGPPVQAAIFENQLCVEPGMINNQCWVPC